MNNPEIVIVLSGDHIYRMDYTEMIDFHRKNGADVTIALQEVPWDETSRFGLVQIGEDGRVIQFQEKPKKDPISNLASLGIYIFDAKFLYQELKRDMSDPNSSHDFGKDIIPRAVREGNAVAHPFAPATFRNVPFPWFSQSVFGMIR